MQADTSVASNATRFGIAKYTWVNHHYTFTGKVSRRLYEQGASNQALKEYVARWLIWARSGVELAEDALSEWDRLVLDFAFGFYGSRRQGLGL